MKKLLVVAVLLLLVGVAYADLIVTGSSGNLAASANFHISGSDLIVTLTNTSSSDVLVPVDVLTGLFFTISGDPALSPVSALLASGSTVFYDPDGPVIHNVGGEWAYANNLSLAPGGANEGISSAGYGLFGGANFNGPDLAPPSAVDGLQYGILSAGDNTATGNPGGILGSGGLIKNSVVFDLSGLPNAFTLADISSVSFQYGTALDEPNVPGDGGPPPQIPEPGTIILVGGGLLAFAIHGRKRMQN